MARKSTGRSKSDFIVFLDVEDEHSRTADGRFLGDAVLFHASAV